VGLGHRGGIEESGITIAPIDWSPVLATSSSFKTTVAFGATGRASPFG
jgi:hypothetical protein